MKIVVLILLSGKSASAYHTKPLKRHSFQGRILVIYPEKHSMEVQGTGKYRNKKMIFHFSRHTKMIKFKEQKRHLKKGLKIDLLREQSSLNVTYVIKDDNNYVKEILLLD
ncbi:MAG: hypothetical protein ACE5GM_08720 [bacterium]